MRRKVLAFLSAIVLVFSSAGFSSGTKAQTNDPIWQWTRLAGNDRYETMAKVVREAYADGSARTIVVATGSNFPDALSGASLAGIYECPVILTKKSALPPEAEAEIRRLASPDGCTVYILGGESAVSETARTMIEEIENVTKTERISGLDRFMTGIAVYEAGKGQWGDTAIIATGFSFADTLAISPYAYAAKAPVFLTKKSGDLNATMEAFFEENGSAFSKVILVGGTSAVSENTEKYFIEKGYQVLRLAGTDRYLTSAEIIRWETGRLTDAIFQPSVEMSLDGIGVATGSVFADALSAVSLLGKTHSVLMLIGNGQGVRPKILEIIDELITPNVKNMKKGYIFGGTAAVNEEIEALLNEAVPTTRVNELREKAVAYMTALSEEEWSPSVRIDLTQSKTGLIYEPGTRYVGLPYTNDWDSSLEEFRSYLEDGVYTGPVTDEECKGVDCSSSILAAWSSVGASVDCVWTKKMLPQYGNGMVKVGEYVIPEGAEGTVAIIAENDVQTIYKAYAEMLPADAMVTYTTSGHARMVVSEPDIRYNADGTISGLSSVITTEIDSSVKNKGDYSTCWIVEHKYYFQELIDKYYVPLTIPELLSGNAPEAEWTVSEENTEESILESFGLRGTLSSNYRIFEVKASVLEAGEILRESLVFPVNNTALVMTSRSQDLGKLNEALDLRNLPKGNYELKLTAKIRGEYQDVLQISFEKTEDPPLSEMRERVVSYYRDLLSIRWTPEETMDFSSDKETLIYEAGKTYAGLPYANQMDSTLEEMMGWMEDGVYVGPKTFKTVIGVDAASSITAAWALVSPSVAYTYSKEMLPGNSYGPVAVGSYDPGERTSLDDAKTTLAIIADSDPDVIYESYAAALPGDALLYRYGTTGASVMVMERPVVVRNDGKIDPDASTISILSVKSVLWYDEEGVGHTSYEESYTFTELIEKYYVPISTPELVSERTEDPEFSLSDELTEEQILENEGLYGTLHSNYRIFSVTAVLSSSGETVSETVRYPVNTVNNKMVGNTFDLSELNNGLALATQKPGEYVLKLSMHAGDRDVEVKELPLVISDTEAASMNAWTALQLFGFSAQAQSISLGEGVSITVSAPANSPEVPFSLYLDGQKAAEGVIPASSESGAVKAAIHWTEGVEVTKESVLEMVSLYDDESYYYVKAGKVTNSATNQYLPSWSASWAASFVREGDEMVIRLTRTVDTEYTGTIAVWVRRSPTPHACALIDERTYEGNASFGLAVTFTANKVPSRTYYYENTLLVTLRAAKPAGEPELLQWRILEE